MHCLGDTRVAVGTGGLLSQKVSTKKYHGCDHHVCTYNSL
jgi:hypothetical protein